MRKHLIYISLAAMVLLLASCRFEDEEYNPYNISSTGWFASNMSKYIMESAVSAMEQKVDNEEVFKDGYYTVQDKEYYSKLEIRKKEGVDSTWVIRNVIDQKDGNKYYAYNFNPKDLEYSLILQLNKEMADGFHSWTASFNANYEQENGYSILLYSMDKGINLKWGRSDYTSSVTYDLEESGRCHAEFYRDGESLEKMDIKYTGSGSPQFIQVK